ncbi:MAG: ABC transporter substrate-binding protein [Smithella sp.]
MVSRKVKRLFSVFLIICMATTAVVADSTLANIVKKGVITVATDMTGVPMQYRDASGKPTGFTVELMEFAAKEMGVTIKWEDLAWESLIPSLLTGKVDMIAANMSMTLSRMKSVRFSDPYFSTGIVVLARKNSSLVKWSDAAAPNVKMGATMGSTHADYMQQNWNKKPALYENLTEWLTDLKNGRIDGVMEDQLIALNLVKKDPDLKVLTGFVRPDTYGLTFRQDQDSDSLVNWFNWFIRWEKMNGNYGKIYEKYV